MAGQTVVITALEAQHAVESALVRHGATATDARLQATILVEAELRGHPSHGLLRVPVLAQRLAAGVAVSGVEPEYRWVTPSALRVDGARNLGPVVMDGVITRLLARVEAAGVVMAAISNAGHVGMLAPHAERFALAGSIVIMLTISEALVHPSGGSRALLGTNPIGIGIPSEPAPIVLDMSTAQVSAGKILDYAGRGESIPLGWAIDDRGRPTTDAEAAAHGSIAPFGGAKGYGLALAFEAMVGVLAGSAFGTDVHGTLDVDQPPTKGDLVVAFSPTALGAANSTDRLGRYLDELRASGSHDDPVRIPGDRARALREERLRTGVPVDATTWARVLGLGAKP